jgi:hypothetical protein
LCERAELATFKGSGGNFMIGKKIGNYEITDDGQRFVMMRNVRSDDETQPAIVIVQNWFEEFKSG